MSRHITPGLFDFLAKGLSLGENLKELQGMLCGVDVPDSQTAIGCFSSEMAIKVAHYIQSSLFQHYTLYTYLFTEDQKDMLITSRVRNHRATPNVFLLLFSLYSQHKLEYQMEISHC